MKRRIIKIMLASLCLATLLSNHSWAQDYASLIIGKWVRTEKTKSFDTTSDQFVKSPFFVSYEFRLDGTFLLTVKDRVEDPHPYRIEGNIIHYSKWDVSGEMEILELTENTLLLKSPVSKSRFTRQE